MERWRAKRGASGEVPETCRGCDWSCGCRAGHAAGIGNGSGYVPSLLLLGVFACFVCLSAYLPGREKAHAPGKVPGTLPGTCRERAASPARTRLVAGDVPGPCSGRRVKRCALPLLCLMGGRQPARPQRGRDQSQARPPATRPRVQPLAHTAGVSRARAGGGAVRKARCPLPCGVCALCFDVFACLVGGRQSARPQ